jgi:hypothetical protein
MQKVFKELLGKLVEAYVDDIVVKTKRQTSSCPTSKRSSPSSENTA